MYLLLIYRCLLVLLSIGIEVIAEDYRLLNVAVGRWGAP